MEIEAEETRSRTSKEFYCIIYTVSLFVCIQQRMQVWVEKDPSSGIRGIGPKKLVSCSPQTFL